MADKDKIVTLEDLKAVYDVIDEKLRGADVWENISGSLTWNSATWLPNSKKTESYCSNYDGYDYTMVPNWSADSTHEKKTITFAKIAKVKICDLAFAAGDKLRITAWSNPEWLDPETGASTGYMKLYGTSGSTIYDINYTCVRIPFVLSVYDQNKNQIDYIRTVEDSNRYGSKVGKNFDSFIYTVPQTASKIFLFDYSELLGMTPGDIIVEKALR